MNHEEASASDLNACVLNMADGLQVRRSDCSDHVLYGLMAAVAAEGGPLPSPISGFELRIEQYHDRALISAAHSRREVHEAKQHGLVFFHFDLLGARGDAMMSNAVCWSEEMQSEGWRRMKELYYRHRTALRKKEFWQNPPAKPPALPWMMTWVTPAGVRLGLDNLAYPFGAASAIAYNIMIRSGSFFTTGSFRPYTVHHGAIPN